MRLRNGSILLVFAGLSLFGCRKKEQRPLEEVLASDEKAIGESEEPADPPPEAPSGKSRCHASPFPPVHLRSSAKNVVDEEVIDSPYAVEIGEPVRAHGGTWLPLLRSGPSSTAALLFVDDAGKSREVTLGRVHGDVGPAVLAGQGDRLFGVQAEGAARGLNLRTFTLERAGAETFEVVFGPELPHRVLTDSSYDLWLGEKVGLIVMENGEGKFERFTVLFEGAGVAAAKHGFAIARAGTLPIALPPASRAREMFGPELVGAGTEVRLGFLVREIEEESEEEASVEAHVLRLGTTGEPKSKPIQLSGAGFSVQQIVGAKFGEVFEFALGGARAEEKPRFEIARVGSDGAVERRALGSEILAPGAGLLPDCGAKAPRWWVGGGDGPVLVEVTSGAALEREIGFGAADPLLFDGARALAVTPRGVDLELGLFECAY